MPQECWGELCLFLLFFLCSGKLSWPLSDILSDDDESSEDEEEEEESDDESDAIPQLFFVSMPSATAARSARFSLKTRSHFLESFGRPRTVLCHTTGKFVQEQKFCVIAMVLSRLMTTCHHPPGTNTVSPGCCTSSNGRCFSGQEGSCVRG